MSIVCVGCVHPWCIQFRRAERLRAERDELLKALKKRHPEPGMCFPGCGTCALIARIEGGK